MSRQGSDGNHSRNEASSRGNFGQYPESDNRIQYEKCKVNGEYLYSDLYEMPEWDALDSTPDTRRPDQCFLTLQTRLTQDLDHTP